jgi:hypothetical protein
MVDIGEIEQSAFVGVSCSNKIIYNIVERDGEFENTGLSIINYLKYDKNKFLSDFFKSQSYEGIKLLLDDEFILGNFYNSQNINSDTLKGIQKLISESEIFKYFYIYNILDDVLIIKTPEMRKLIALDYKNSNDVRNFINKLKIGEVHGKL